MATKTLAETIRSIKVGCSRKITAINSNVARATAARVLGAGNYTVTKISDTTFDVARVA